MRERKSQGVLDDVKRREIVAILSVGCSRRTAARYVGCSPTTIANTAQRDAHFAAELRKAGEASEIHYLKSIQNAAKKEQYWRAAAWALERCHPDRYAARHADSYSREEVQELLDGLVQIIIEEVEWAAYRTGILKRLDGLLRGSFVLGKEAVAISPGITHDPAVEQEEA